MNVIYILWLRELKKYSRSPAQIIVMLAQPTMYLLILGFGLGPVFQRAGQGSYLQFMAPGVIGMSILFTSIFNMNGLPAISLPLHQAADTGLPIGVQVVAGPWQEALLLRVASQLEQALPWSDRRPDLDALT